MKPKFLSEKLECKTKQVILKRCQDLFYAALRQNDSNINIALCSVYMQGFTDCFDRYNPNQEYENGAGI